MQELLTFQRWMRQLRAELDLTQESLAEAVGCAAHTIRAFERGIRRPSRAMAERLANVLHVPQDRSADFVRLARGALPRVSEPPPAPDTAEQHTERALPHGAAEPLPILASKLYRPQPRAELVPRPRLRVRLDRSLEAPLTLIAAPPGFGKTTLLADWLAHADRPDAQVAWLSLDATDCDPVQFLRYLTAALQTVAPGVGRSITALLQSVFVPPFETLLPLLLHELAALPDPCLLILDDYHAADAPAIQQVLTFLVEHQPPQLHLIMATRADPPLPLARMRVRRQLVELRAEDLRFTEEEAAQFLRDCMGLPLTAADMAVLEARTEGWIAGLQLAALSMRDRPPERMADFIGAFTGSNRFVMEYLADEVLARQPADMLTFLLHTSILERLNASLCDALMAENLDAPHSEALEHQGASRALLEQLERSQLFLVPLDDERRWYRYHHLFAQLLRERLLNSTASETIAQLHRRAGLWFERQGLLVEAVQHTVTAGDWESAARLIEQHGMSLFGRGRMQLVLDWLAALPDAVVRQRPALCIMHAVALRFTDQLAASEARLRDAEHQIQANVPDAVRRTLQGQVVLTRAILDDVVGDLAARIERSREALRLLPETETLGRASALAGLAHAYLVTGDVTPAAAAEAETIVAQLRRMGNVFALLAASNALAQLQSLQGRLRRAEATYRDVEQTLTAADTRHVLDTNPAYWFGRGQLLYEWNQLDAAREHFAQGMQITRGNLTLSAIYVAQGYLALARLQWATGEHAEAYALLDEFERLAYQRRFVPRLFARGMALRARFQAEQGDLDAALQWAAAQSLPAADDYPHEFEALVLADVWIAQGRTDPKGSTLPEAVQLLNRVHAAAAAGGRRNGVIAARIRTALALDAQADRRGAAAMLEQALIHAAPEGYVRSFVDEGAPMALLLAHALETPAWGRLSSAGAPDVRAAAQRLLAVLQDEGIVLPLVQPNPPLLPGDEPLTEREREVLRLLARGCSNQTIAEQLVVAVGTVKRHVHSIMGKLQVQSRLEAVARAHERGLL